MTAPAASIATPAARLWPRTAHNARARAVGLVLIGTALLALAAHIQVPFWPVKLSMQSFVVLGIGIAYGGRLGVATIVAYMLEGAVGLPVFQGGAGVVYMMGPTAGYLLGFVLVAGVVGYCTERGAMRRIPTALGAILLGEVAIYAPGVAWLAVLFGAEKSVAYGVMPFVSGEVLKVALVLALVPAIRRMMR